MSINRIRLGSVIDKVQIKQENWHESNLIVFGVSNTEGIVITQHKKADNTSSYLVLHPNHFAYNPYRINVGSIGLSNNDCSGLVSPAYVVFKVDETKYLSKFILDFLKSNQGLIEINKYAAGTVRKALRYSDLCKIEIPEISLIQQKKLYEKIELNKPAFNELINQVSLQKEYLAKLKQSIL